MFLVLFKEYSAELIKVEVLNLQLKKLLLKMYCATYTDHRKLTKKRISTKPKTIENR